MKAIPSTLCRIQPLRTFACLLLLLASSLAPSARAGLTFTVDLIVSGGSYRFYTPLDTNAAGSNAVFGTYTLSSPSWPANGSWRQLVYDTNGFIATGGYENSYSNLASAIQQITNGTWTLEFTGSAATNTNHFTVSLPGGLTTNQLPTTIITSPTNGATTLTNQPTFSWQSQPTNWPVSGLVQVLQNQSGSGEQSFYYQSAVAISQSNWTPAIQIPASGPDAVTFFFLNFATNYGGTLFVASPPVNIANSQPISDWACNSTLESGDAVGFSVAPPPSSSTNHTLVAHYTFDTTDLGHDDSTNANSLGCGSSWGANTLQEFTADAHTGGGAVQFFGQSSMTPCGGSPVFTNWTKTLFGSFTLSTWIKTANVVGYDTDPLLDYTGQTVLYLNNNGHGLIPLGITGTKAAFFTGVAPGAYDGDTLHSTNSITSGSYAHVVVTRDAGSGLKQIFINGVLDSSDYGEPGVLNGGADYASLGGQLSSALVGKLDDVQIYSGVLTPFEVGLLYATPSSTIPDGPSVTLGVAVNAPNLTWTTSGDSPWFLESTNTHDGVLAVQSGIVTNDQISVFQTTVVGPGSVSFWWQCLADSGDVNNYEVDFATNGDYVDYLYPGYSWTQRTYDIAPGTNVLTWTAYAFGDNNPAEMSFLDEFIFTSTEVQLVEPLILGSDFSFSVDTVYGYEHDAEYTDDLNSNDWHTFAVLIGDGTRQPVSYPVGDSPKRFFRIVTHPFTPI